MKKLALIIAAVLVMTVSFCACSSNSDTANSMSLSEVYKDIKSQVTLSEMNELDSAESLDRYYGIAAQDVSEFAGGINNSGVEQEEIVLIKAVDSDAAKRVKQSLDARYQAKINENKNYNPEQAEMIEKCSVEQDDLYITMIISENSDTITQIYKNDIQ